MPTSARPLSEPSTKESVEAILRAYVDPATAATAVKIACRHWLRMEPEALVPAQLLGLTQGLTPLLEELLGAQLARAATDRILRSAAR